MFYISNMVSKFWDRCFRSLVYATACMMVLGCTVMTETGDQNLDGIASEYEGLDAGNAEVQANSQKSSDLTIRGDEPDNENEVQVGNQGIVNGTTTNISNYPYTAMMASNWGGQYCGASIIDAYWVVTAAHCDPYNSDKVVVGASSTNNIYAGQVINVAQVIEYPYYNTNSVANVTITNSSWYGSNQITSGMIMAGTNSDNADTCYGDSGGPLAIPDGNGGFHLAGITSWGIGCNEPNYPGVYTRISTYADWIYSATGIDPSGSGGSTGGSGGTTPPPTPSCPAGEYADCAGICFDSSYLGWIGDTYCDDGTWGLVLNCEEYGGDCDDCGLSLDDPNEYCGSTGTVAPEDCDDSGWLEDCAGVCINNMDGVYTGYDCVVDNGNCTDQNGDGVIISWVGDGYCDDGAYGVELNCPEYDDDGCDCGDLDACGVCDGNGASCLDCLGAANGSAEEDTCGVCNGDDGDQDCLGVCFGGAGFDACGVCDGDGSSCLPTCAVLGDVDENGILNVVDVLLAVDAVLYSDGDNTECADIDGNGALSVVDILLIVDLVFNFWG
jgi:hypothetical protein